MRNRAHLFSWNESLISKTNCALATAHFDPGLRKCIMCAAHHYTLETRFCDVWSQWGVCLNGTLIPAESL